ncbi:MAG TPA: hypothetical protein PKM35_09275 [Holophaga sp.]|nr:hypothetical protein [Holophaga sp.]HPS66890.1 hypothetical protein [Holophaga sp.]
MASSPRILLPGIPRTSEAPAGRWAAGRLRILAILAAPCAARANAGIPVGGDSIALCIQWFVAVVALEYLVLRHDLKTGFRRSLGIVAAANLLSTVAGVVVNLATLFVPILVEPSLGSRSRGADLATLVLFVPLFFLSWWIEGAFAVRRLREFPRAAVWRCLFRANLGSYAMLSAFVLVRAFLRAR